MGLFSFFFYWLFSGLAWDWVDVVSTCFMGLFSFFVFAQKLSAKTALRVQFDTPPTPPQAQLQNGQ